MVRSLMSWMQSLSLDRMITRRGVCLWKTRAMDASTSSASAPSAPTNAPPCRWIQAGRMEMYVRPKISRLKWELCARVDL